MARMVFGNMTQEIAPPRAEHFAATKLPGAKTACGVMLNSNRYSIIRSWKEWKMVTCKRCLAMKESD